MMMQTGKVVWAEGILLGQQHFQQWDKYQDNQRQLSRRYVYPHAWGIAEIEWDATYLPEGQFHLTQCVLLLKDGRWIEYHSSSDGVVSITLPTQQTSKLNIVLTIADGEQVEGISGYPDASKKLAWHGQYQSISDIYDANRTREVLLAKPKLKLALEGTEEVSNIRIKIAELEFNNAVNCYQMLADYMPPVLQIRASKTIMAWLANFIFQLKKQLNDMHELKEKFRQIDGRFGYDDFIYFNLTKTFRTHLLAMQTIQQNAQCHPIILYQACMELLSELSAYQQSQQVETNIPSYSNEHLTAIFGWIQNHFQQLASHILPENTLDIPLISLSDAKKQTARLPQESLQNKQFCLALYQEEMSEALIQKILKHVKIAAPSQLEEIVHSFTQGIELHYTDSPGKQFSAKHHYHYFSLNKQNARWNSIIEEGVIAIFMSNELTSLPFELICFS